ncbi:MAG: gliding motility-associated C-terminal domain-containing protein [Bacteroidales bacterium]|nr:gliding motility-associated C-terminal domain-containing protein [Bacteroidales bacterium]
MKITSCFGIKYFTCFIVFLVFCINIVYSQPVSNKKGGISFRIDGNPSIEKLKQVDSVFSKYGMNFGMSMSVGDLPLHLDYVQFIKKLQLKGHELMDHSPTGQTQYFDLLNEQDTSLYIGDLGVDHFIGSRVCLKYSSFDTSKSHNEGLVKIEGNMIISRIPGEFKDLSNFIALYFRQLNKICLWTSIHATNPNDVDTVYVQTFWEGPIDLGILDNVSYHLLSRNDIIMSPQAIQLLGKRTLKICSDLSIPRPITWIHPGGKMPYFSTTEIKDNFGDKLLYKEAASYYYPSLLCFNEYNPNGIKPFGMQFGTTSFESTFFKWNKKLIANQIAKNYTTIVLSDLYNPLGGWTSFLKRVDSLLFWCSRNDIPVNTHAQWKAILYDYTPNGSINAIPKLNVDLDEDLFPDGYNNTVGYKGIYSTNDGVPESGNCCFQISETGTICSISSLGGLQKGKNAFSIYTKANEGVNATIEVQFYFPENGTTKSFQFLANSVNWEKQTDTLAISDSINLVNVFFTNTSSVPGSVKISGMSLTTTGPLIVDFNYTKVCVGNTTILTSTSTPFDDIISYSWDLNGDGKFDDGTGSVVSYAFSSSGYHNVGLKVMNKKGEIKAIYKLVGVGEVLADFTFENECVEQPIQFVNTSSVICDTVISYSWNFGDGEPLSHEENPIHSFVTSGDFNVSLSVTTINDCNDSKINIVTISGNPTVSIQFSNDTVFYKGDSVVVSVPSGLYDSVYWSNGSKALEITIYESGTYSVYVYKNKCSSQKSFHTYVKEYSDIPIIMNLFTPNSDGKNDYWEILNLLDVGPCDVDIYNRYGEHVFSEVNYQNDWDGLFHDKVLTNDTYYYLVRCKNRKVFQGTVNILK